MNEIKGIVSGNEVDISKVAMIVNGVDKGWEVRTQNGNILWAADRTLTGTDTIQMKGYGLPLKSVHIEGNTQQTGTPAPDAPIMPDFCGKLSGSDWIIPITCAAQTTSIYLGQVSTVRRIKKHIFTGEENITDLGYYYNTNISVSSRSWSATVSTTGGFQINNSGNRIWVVKNYFPDYTTPDAFKIYLQQQYANGTPVVVWYVLAEPETAIINEPLAKIGDYADELHSEDAGVTIPTAVGTNTLTVNTTLPPSEITVVGHVKAVNA